MDCPRAGFGSHWIVFQGLNVRRGDYRRAGFCVVTDLGCKRGNEKDLGDRPNAASGNFSELLQV